MWSTIKQVVDKFWFPRAQAGVWYRTGYSRLIKNLLQNHWQQTEYRLYEPRRQRRWLLTYLFLHERHHRQKMPRWVSAEMPDMAFELNKQGQYGYLNLECLLEIIIDRASQGILISTSLQVKRSSLPKEIICRFIVSCLNSLFLSSYLPVQISNLHPKSRMQ